VENSAAAAKTFTAGIVNPFHGSGGEGMMVIWAASFLSVCASRDAQ
jgi:hypothetical protein